MKAKVVFKLLLADYKWCPNSPSIVDTNGEIQAYKVDQSQKENSPPSLEAAWDLVASLGNDEGHANFQNASGPFFSKLNLIYQRVGESSALKSVQKNAANNLVTESYAVNQNPSNPGGTWLPEIYKFQPTDRHAD